MTKRIFPRPPLGRDFAGDESAMAAVEFALILPLLVTLLFAGIDITEAVAARRKTIVATSTMSDLVAQSKEVTTADIDNFLTAGAAIIPPFDANELETVLTNVVMDANAVPTVAWSVGRHAEARTKGTSFPVPAKLRAANTSVVVAEVNFDYKPILIDGVVGPIKMVKTTFAMPRVASKTTGVPCKWAGC
jgi:Flp pilus assembly protein TadG